MDQLETIEDNFVEYSIFLPHSFAQSVEETLQTIHSIINEYCGTFIWNRDPPEFHLKPVDWHQCVIGGKMYFGDCVDDEWFLVGALWHLSTKIQESLIRVVDNDGEFTLIECANQLPRWMQSPTVMENRVFMRGGRMQIIPQSVTISSNSKEISLEQAVRLLIDKEDDDEGTRAPKELEHAIWKRIKSIDPQTHIIHIPCILPRSIARVLEEQPQWISAAVEAFYCRDLISQRVCHKMTTFPPETSVLTRIAISRPLYAQLTCQKYYPTKPFLRVETLAQLFSRPAAHKKEAKWAEIGMKIACGFEILLKDKFYSTKEEENDTDKSAMTKDAEGVGVQLEELQQKYSIDQSLTDCTNLVSKYLTHKKQYNRSPWSANIRSQPQRNLLVDWAYSNHKLSADAEFDEYLNSKGYWTNPEEIDESWLYINEQELEQMLQERTATTTAKHVGADGDLKPMMDDLQSFILNQQSGVDGVDGNANEHEDDMDTEEEGAEGFWSTDEEEWEEEEIEEFKSMLKALESELCSTNLADPMPADGQNDYELAKNLLASFEAQAGQSGPASTLFNSLGYSVGRNEEADEDSDDDDSQ